MKLEHGVSAASDSFKDEPWNVVGHTYTPKILSDNIFLWHAVLPAETFVPPHIHNSQDEWIHVLEGTLEVEFGGETHTAKAGDVVRMPQGEPHGIFNRSGAEAKAMFGVSPAGELFQLFQELNGVTDPAELVRLSAARDVDFLPPPDAA
ncbi:MAG: cupin domain-containing protein [Pseudomonadota bacterium]